MNGNLLRALAAAALFACCATAKADEKITFLLPAPANLPAFAPFRLAKAEGYFKAAGLDVTFQVAKGGVDVATQVAVGNADPGGAIGDTAILVRPNGLRVKGVALLGGHALTQIIVRKDANIRSFADLKGKAIGVLSYQESAYFNLLGVLASEGLTPREVSAEAVGAWGSVQLMVAGKLAAICAAPDLGALIENAGVKVHYLSIDKAFPAMAQAIGASDKTIAARPQMVASFVAATLHAMRDIMADPQTTRRRPMSQRFRKTPGRKSSSRRS